MLISNLTQEEIAVVYDCLKCVASGKVIPHDWEFQTLFGIDVSEFLEITEKWPNVDDTDVNVKLAINNSMNNLLEISDGEFGKWDNLISHTKEEVEKVFRKWRDEK